MANRYPLTINNSSTLVGELPNGDSLNLSGSGIFDGSSLGTSGQVLKSTGSSLQWSRAADVYREDAQTLLNKTLSSCIFNASLNTLTNVSNASLINSSISINGTNVSLGGSITIDDQNDNTIYGISFVDGANAAQKRLRMTAGGTGSGVQDLFFVAGDNVTITKNASNDTLTFSSALTKLRANTGSYVEGSISLTGSGGTSVSRSGQTFTFASDAFPIGGIIIWSGSANNIPTKWTLCDGTSAGGVATPDLRDRFIIGAGSGYSPGSTGGSKDAIVVSHQHTATTGNNSSNHTHGGSTGNQSASHKHNGSTGNNSGNHTHGGSTGNNSSNHSHGGSTGNNSSSHSHSGNTGNQSRNHTHGGNTGNQSSNHRHGYSRASGGSDHDGEGNSIPLWRRQYENANSGGITSNHYHGFNTSGISQNHSHSFNTGNQSSNHSHNFNTGNQSANHTHNFNTGNQSANHTHNFTTGNQDANHTHNFTTGNQSANHTHDLTTSTQGSSGTNKNLPPYYALCYIMKYQ